MSSFQTYHNMPYNRRVMRIKRLINSRLRDLRDRMGTASLQREYEARIREAKQRGEEDLANRLRFEGNAKLHELMVQLMNSAFSCGRSMRFR